jgi:murein DD-endopeptidase MepM/ murein hydrolase activator NlpD
VAHGAGNRFSGKRAKQHVLIIASGDRIRHLTLRPWMMGLSLSLAGLLLAGYLGATSYLVLRDDLIGATITRQTRMQQDYEDRIAGLRAQLDRITSRQLLDQQVVEKKVEKLLEQQDALFSRHGKLGSLLERAEQSGLPAPDADASFSGPTSLEERASSVGGTTALTALMSITNSSTSGSGPLVLRDAHLREGAADRADRVFSKMTLSLKSLENEQMEKIADLTSGAAKTAAEIEAILQRTGVALDQSQGVGGPFVEPIPEGTRFDASLGQLDAALTRLETVRETARDLPYANPAPGRGITSRFGNRLDPFIGRLALHAGIDFEARTGDDVRSTGAGQVTAAGPSGGYGNMVEVDHGYGISTRYGHLSRVLVSVGDRIKSGDLIGRAGSTGRSTGPHVHYEVRRDGQPVDPIHFLNAGMKLTTYLE